MFNDKVSGHFEVAICDAFTGKKRRVLNFDNLILNSGLNGYFTTSFSGQVWCVVGSGNSEPQVTNESLDNFVAWSSIGISSWTPVLPNPPEYVAEIRANFRFNAGTISQNISEIGICNAASTAYWCRSLIIDEFGNPTTLSVLPTEYLDVVYTLRYHPDLEDRTFNVLIDNVTYNCVLRQANVGAGFGTSTTPLVYAPTPIRTVYSTQTLGEITSSPSSVSSNINLEPTELAYVNNSFKRGSELLLTLGAGNLDGGIGSMVIGREYSGIRDRVQVSFSPKIPKNANTEMRFTLERSLGRWQP